MSRATGKQLKRVFGHRNFLLVSVVLLVLFGVAFSREYWRNHQIQSMISQMEAQTEALEARNIEIAQINAQLESEGFLEREARLRLGLVKPGERVVVVTDEDLDTEDVTEDIGGKKIEVFEEDIEAESRTSRWALYFFNKDRFDRIYLNERGKL